MLQRNRDLIERLLACVVFFLIVGGALALVKTVNDAIPIPEGTVMATWNRPFEYEAYYAKSVDCWYILQYGDWVPIAGKPDKWRKP